MDKGIDFLKPRLVGKRFEDHSIPLEILEDFGALEEMLIEVAKWLYIKEHPERKRVPKGFNSGFSLKLSGIEEGSAKAVITMATLMVGLFPYQNDTYKYLEQAKEKIIESIYAAENGDSATKIIPENLLAYFNRIGKRLHDDEAIEFSSPNSPRAKLTKDIRKRLLLSLSNVTEISEEVSVRAFIPEIDKGKQTFTIELENGQRLIALIESQHKESILQAFHGYDCRTRVIISGVGNINRLNKIVSFKTVEHISILDPLDISTRLDEFVNLQAGWFDGELGIAFEREHLDWLSIAFEAYYGGELPSPYLYPTVDGGIQAEWSLTNYELSLTFDLKQKTASYLFLQLDNNETEEGNLNVASAEGWAKLNEKLKTYML